MRLPLQAVLFDYGHTLIHFDERPHAHLLEAYRRINRLLEEQLTAQVPQAEVLIREVSAAVDDEIQRDYASGREEEVEIAGIYDRFLRRLGLELTPELIERVMELEQEGWLGSVHVGPEVPSTLDRLRQRGLRLGLVSNAAYLPRLMRGQLAALGLMPYFDSVTFSSQIGFRKPHPAIYADALARLGVDATDTLFIGDRVKEDVQGPSRLGMRTVLLREWRQEEDPDGLADFTIDRLGQLVPVVESLHPESPRTGTYN